MVEYDKIAEDYTSLSELRPGKKYSYNYSLFNIIGDLTGKKILDLACGEGVLSRRAKFNGASEVVGVDISNEMIKLAQLKESQIPRGINYIVWDVINLKKINEFDIVMAGFLLHYSKSKKELDAMCKNIYQNLKNGGRFIALNNDPDFPLFQNSKYGAIITSENPELKEGDKLTVTFYLNSKKRCSFNNYYWKKQTYENSLKKAGLKDIKWHQLKVSEEGIKKYGNEFWQDFLKKPYLTIIEATK